ncbi:MAG: glycosyltransferase [Parvularculaceae bacterium]
MTSDPTPNQPRIGYLVNQYPTISHTFITREILELERLDAPVTRYALRKSDVDFSDKVMQDENAKTRHMLAGSKGRLAITALGQAFRNIGKMPKLLGMCFKAGIKPDRGRIYPFLYLAEALVLGKWLKLDGITHLHAHFGTNTAFIARLAYHITGIPYSFTVHGPEEFDRPISLGLRDKIHDSKFVVAVSSFGRSQLMRWCSYDQWAKIKVVHCALDPAYWAGKTKPTAPSGYLCVGRICEQKGQLLLLEAIKQLRDEGVDIPLTLGGDGDMRPQADQFIRQNQLENLVTITGWIDSGQVCDLILKSRAMVLTSFAEGLPVVLMEAMFLKTPVITTYIAGIPELVSDGVNGWMIPAGDVQAIKRALKSAHEASLEDLAGMGEAAHHAAMRDHVVTDQVPILLDAIEEEART